MEDASRQGYRGGGLLEGLSSRVSDSARRLSVAIGSQRSQTLSPGAPCRKPRAPGHTDPGRQATAVASRVLSDAEADEIRRGLAAGLRGPVLIKWCRLLLADRDERRARELTMRGPWPGPLAGPSI